MGKSAAPRRAAENEAMAVNLNLRGSPQKINQVAALIRGKPVARALAELEFCRRRAAGDVKKTLESAVANAENNHNLDVDRLFVAHAFVGKSIVMKRWRARAKGRASSIRKPLSRLTVVVREFADGQ